MREFNGLASFAAFAAGMVVEVDHAKHQALEKGAQIVEDEAKRVIGTYDLGWPPLAASTVARKGADTPLLETGEMRDSIEHTVGHDQALIGSNLDKAVWQELGTSRIPPRPFLMGAATAKGQDVAEVLGKNVVKVLTKS